jgi:tetratricopeptide (TPR) repeat protein
MLFPLLCCALFSHALPAQTEQALEAIRKNPRSSLAHYQAGELFLEQNNFQSAANEFREALNGDLDPPWIKVWSHLRLAAVFTRTGQRERAANSLRQALDTKDNTRGAQSVVNSLLGILAVDAGARTAPAVSTLTAKLRLQPPYSDEGLAAGLEGVVLLTAVRAVHGGMDFTVTERLGLGLDEQAERAAREQGQHLAPGDRVAAEFVLPQRDSRWHLVAVSLQAPKGVRRPLFHRTVYPGGPGLSNAALDHAQIMRAIGRHGTATIRFLVDEHGRTRDLELLQASDPLWGREAFPILAAWEFEPGSKEGWPVAVPVEVTLVWGDRNMPAELFLQTARNVAGARPQ